MELNGEAGDDDISGGDGNDVIDGGNGDDGIDGVRRCRHAQGFGRRRHITATDGVADTIDCGSETTGDEATVDIYPVVDVTTGCEVVERVGPASVSVDGSGTLLYRVLRRRVERTALHGLQSGRRRRRCRNWCRQHNFCRVPAAPRSAPDSCTFSASVWRCIDADLGDGNDSATVSGTINTRIQGGADSDRLTGGAGNDVLSGGAGDRRASPGIPATTCWTAAPTATP